MPNARDVFLFVYYGASGEIQPSRCPNLPTEQKLHDCLAGILHALRARDGTIPDEPSQYVLYDWALNEISPDSLTVYDIPKPGIVIAVCRQIGNLAGRAHRLKSDALRDASLRVAIDEFIAETEQRSTHFKPDLYL